MPLGFSSSRLILLSFSRWSWESFFECDIVAILAMIKTGFVRIPIQRNVTYQVFFLFWINWQGIKQFFVAVEREEWKFDTLCDLYDTLTITQAVIFCNTKRKVNLHTLKQYRWSHCMLFSAVFSSHISHPGAWSVSFHQAQCKELDACHLQLQIVYIGHLIIMQEVLWKLNASRSVL